MMNNASRSPDGHSAGVPRASEQPASSDGDRRHARPRYGCPKAAQVLTQIAANEPCRQAYVAQNSVRAPDATVLRIRTAVFTLVTLECQLEKLLQGVAQVLENPPSGPYTFADLEAAWHKVGAPAVDSLFRPSAGELDFAKAPVMRRILIDRAAARKGMIRGWPTVALQASAATTMLRTAISSLTAALLSGLGQRDFDEVLAESLRRVRLARAVAEPLRLKVHWNSIRSALARLHRQDSALRFPDCRKDEADWTIAPGVSLAQASVGAALKGVAEAAKSAVVVALHLRRQALNGGAASALTRRQTPGTVSTVPRTAAEAFRGVLRAVVYSLMRAGGEASLPKVIEGLQHALPPKNFAERPAAPYLVKFQPRLGPGAPVKSTVYHYELLNAGPGQIKYGALSKAVCLHRQDYRKL